jgi:hypothetical protein
VDSEKIMLKLDRRTFGLSLLYLLLPWKKSKYRIFYATKTIKPSGTMSMISGCVRGIESIGLINYGFKLRQKKIHRGNLNINLTQNRD